MTNNIEHWILNTTVLRSLKKQGIIMKTLRVVFWVLIVLFVIGIFMPQDYKIERSIEISSQVEQSFELSNDLTQWPLWSPWVAMDPSVKVTIGNISKGVGATQSWTDDNGGGRLTFIESVPDKRITYHLWFGDAQSPATSHMTFEQITANKIKVYWTIEGDMQMPVIGFILAMLMDTLVGPAFELGLENLKRESELIVD